MESHAVIKSTEIIAIGLEIFGISIIAVAYFYAILLSILNFIQRKKGTFENLKIYMGKALLLSLEFLVAADIIRTVIIEPSRESLLLLGLLISVRTFLSWSITVEIEGCWPWQVWKKRSE
jgi:uncharacterized membrane protein